MNYIETLTTLGHEGRMAVFRLLMRRYPEFVPAGDLAKALGAKANTMSVYLSALQGAGLIHQRREGRSVLYQANPDGADALVSYLYADCCRGRPALCDTGAVPQAGQGDGKANILFLCSGNSARSIFAEALLRDMAGDRFAVYSAGTRPKSVLNPIALKMLRDKEHDTSPLRAKHISEFQTPDAPVMDYVFTVCDLAANEDCPPWPGQPITAHWGVPDPVLASGTDAEKRLAFQQAYGVLKQRIKLFTALRPETLQRAALQAGVDEISKSGDYDA